MTLRRWRGFRKELIEERIEDEQERWGETHQFVVGQLLVLRSTRQIWLPKWQMVALWELPRESWSSTIEVAMTATDSGEFAERVGLHQRPGDHEDDRA